MEQNTELLGKYVKWQIPISLSHNLETHKQKEQRNHSRYKAERT